MMRISPAGIALTSSFEGWRSKAYRDSGKKWTIGWGHLIRPNEEYLLLSPISREVGDHLLKTDMRLAEDCVNANWVLFTPPIPPLSIEQHQYDAIVDFTFNCGCRNFRNSTLLRRLRKGDTRAADELLIWNQAGGRVIRGLIRRRAVEWNMFNGKEVDLL